MPLQRNPVIYEINTWVWLADLRQRYGADLTLGNIPAEVFDDLQRWNVDAVWMMGVWERSPRSREIGQHHPDLQGEFKRSLPGYTADRVSGSPYAVHRYEVDARLGGRDGLAAFRQQLHQRGMSLILDYVPNHVAVDHPLTVESPDCFIRGTGDDAEDVPEYFFAVPETGAVIAHGRDPYFPAWTDTAQIDAFSPTARQWSLNTVLDIASQCDGVRCDMSMLMVNRIFANTWASIHKDIPDVEFWTDVIPPVKKQYPGFIFMAEVYWHMEAELQFLGFDYTYDKRLYDRMLHETPGTVRDHLLASMDYQCKLVRFVENHDEQRAAASFGLDKSKAAAVLAMTLPGAKLLHEGQFEGRKIKVPVQLDHRANEPANERLQAFYRLLNAEVRHPAYHDGIYMALATSPILEHDEGCRQLIAFAWALGQEWRVVVVNLSDQPVKGRVMLPRPEFAGATLWCFQDALKPELNVSYTGDQLLVTGLPIELGTYQSHIFSISQQEG